MPPSDAPAFIAEHLKCFAHTWDDDAPAPEVRFVVRASKTTGLDRTRDRLITIGAVAVVGDEIPRAGR